MSAEVVTTVAETRRRIGLERRSGLRIGLVPTMGALHAGHAALIERARAGSDYVAVSIFVNPTQFDRKDDYERYSRTLPEDVALCTGLGTNLIFAPDASEMYPAPPDTSVIVARVSEGLCGQFRPGHFQGVATVVAKLFHILQPDVAYFGEKDAQQLAVIRRMVADLNMPVEIVGVETIREPDGLALSSRNRRLNSQERAAAPILYQSLLVARRLVGEGCQSAGEIRRSALNVLAEEPAVRLEYFEIVAPDDMTPVDPVRAPVRIAIAAWLGSTRLIDNVLAG
ncbi:MAG: pantoate--beta-alanine ligase [Bryobacteraceae bacterium]